MCRNLSRLYETGTSEAQDSLWNYSRLHKAAGPWRWFCPDLSPALMDTISNEAHLSVAVPPAASPVEHRPTAHDEELAVRQPLLLETSMPSPQVPDAASFSPVEVLQQPSINAPAWPTISTWSTWATPPSNPAQQPALPTPHNALMDALSTSPAPGVLQQFSILRCVIAAGWEHHNDMHRPPNELTLQVCYAWCCCCVLYCRQVSMALLVSSIVNLFLFLLVDGATTAFLFAEVGAHTVHACVVLHANLPSHHIWPSCNQSCSLRPPFQISAVLGIISAGRHDYCLGFSFCFLEGVLTYITSILTFRRYRQNIDVH